MLALLGYSMSESGKKEKKTILHDFTIWSISLVFEVILTYSWRRGGGSIRHGAFIRGGCLIQTLHFTGGVY